MAKVFSNNAYQENKHVNQTTQMCVDHIYNSIDISRFRYKLLEFKNDLPQLLEKKFFVSPNFSGSNCLLVFSKIKDKYYQFLVDRKTLYYNTKKIDYDSIKLMHVDIKLDINVYKDRGTIFDGVLVHNNNRKIFIITDVYLFKGQNTVNTPINMKLSSVSTYFDSTYKGDKNNEMKIMINELYELDEVDTLINKKIPEKKEFLIKGICFYPEFSSLKFIYMFDNKTRNNGNNGNNERRPVFKQITKNSDSYQNPNKQNLNQNAKTSSPTPQPQVPTPPKTNALDPQLIISTVKKAEKSVYMPKPGKMDTDYVFEMKKTDTVDVYNLNIIEPVAKDNGTGFKLKRVKIGLAFVSGLERSKWCQEVMNKANGSTLVHCKFINEKQKWEPISVVSEDGNKPSMVSDFSVV
jgi:hypothetical protein